MNKIYIKIHRWDPHSKSLIVSFASDQTKSQNPDDYPQLAIQPMNMWPGVDTIEQIMKNMSNLARIQCEMTVRQEVQNDNLELIGKLEVLAGKEYTFDEFDIINDAFAQGGIEVIEEIG